MGIDTEYVSAESRLECFYSQTEAVTASRNTQDSAALNISWRETVSFETIAIDTPRTDLFFVRNTKAQTTALNRATKQNKFLKNILTKLAGFFCNLRVFHFV